MTNFSLFEFHDARLTIERTVLFQYEGGRGNKYGSKPKVIFFMVLSTLKSSGNYYFNRLMIRIKSSTFRGMVIGFFDKICPLPFENLVQKYESSLKMSSLVKEESKFKK